MEFCLLYGIGKRGAERIATYMSTSVTPPADGRGKHENRANAIPENITLQVDTNIGSFPRRSSHYSREHQKNRTDIHTPQEYKALVKNTSPRKFFVIDVKQDDVRNFVTHLKPMLLQKGKSTTNAKFTISCYRIFHYSGSSQASQVLQCCSHQNGLYYEDFRLLKATQLITLDAPPAYVVKLPIKDAKLRDTMKLAE
ncbi:hypothetical protein PR048_016278 [Dryococelus australis]|uniref:Uncharacterized protein n=1 Tax=Dryococelus australis TaxID=614101 RepID=A0ABQ9HJW2_9NEOP|nr:hypothetical protein PR048_016278 [Dryococelus australis]